MALFGEDSGTLHGSTLFGHDSTDKDHHPVDPWSAPSQALASDSTSATRVSRLLIDVLVPEIYSAAFHNANPIAGEVDATALTQTLKSADLSDAQVDNIIAIVSQGRGTLSSVDRGTWNVAMALAGFAQRGSEELNLDLVDFAQNCM